MYSGRRVREPISAKLRKRALAKAKNTCQYPKCKTSNKYVMLQAHHINLKNDNNRPSNIKMLCPTHHAVVHHKQSKKYGVEQKRIKKNREKEIKKKKIEIKLLEQKRKKLIKRNALKKKKVSKKKSTKRKVRRKPRSIFDDLF